MPRLGAGAFDKTPSPAYAALPRGYCSATTPLRGAMPMDTKTAAGKAKAPVSEGHNQGPKETVTVTDNANGQTIELPLLPGTLGPKVVDIRKLYSDLGHFTFDPGYTATGSCESKITYIDGDEGVLLYRGYPIEELAEHSDFMEVSYLLLNGELPTPAQK